MDEELRRIVSIMNKLDELSNALWMIEKRCGKESRKRAARYLKDRKGWVLDMFFEN